MQEKVLLIGNGPSALSMKLGKEIDEFPIVVRFNAYITKGYEDYVGTKTDMWVTCSSHPRWWKDYDKVFLCSYSRRCDNPILLHLRQRYPDVEHFNEKVWRRVLDEMHYTAPSSGAVAATYFSQRYETYIYGFDFFQTKQHHYADNVPPGPNHTAKTETKYFGKLLRKRKIFPFHDYLRKQNSHIFEAGIENERDKYVWLYSGGCPSYGGRNHGRNTYPIIKDLNPASLLDVGCGKGQYVEWCKAQGIEAVGLDFASGYGIRGDVCDLPFDADQFEMVTAFDLLEHLELDKLRKALSEMCRVARRGLLLSIGYGPSRVKTPDTWVELHPIHDKHEDWWRETLSEFGTVTKVGKDFANNSFLVVEPPPAEAELRA